MKRVGEIGEIKKRILEWILLHAHVGLKRREAVDDVWPAVLSKDLFPLFCVSRAVLAAASRALHQAHVSERLANIFQKISSMLGVQMGDVHEIGEMKKRILEWILLVGDGSRGPPPDNLSVAVFESSVDQS